MIENYHLLERKPRIAISLYTEPLSRGNKNLAEGGGGEIKRFIKSSINYLTIFLLIIRCLSS